MRLILFIADFVIIALVVWVLWSFYQAGKFDVKKKKGGEKE